MDWHAEGVCYADFIHLCCRSESNGQELRNSSFVNHKQNNCIVAYATSRGQRAYRNSQNGSFYWKALEDALAQHAVSSDLTNILNQYVMPNIV